MQGIIVLINEIPNVKIYCTEDGKIIDTFSGYCGKGIRKTKEGDGYTPIGLYKLGICFGRKPFETKMKYIVTTENDIIVDDPNSKYYNMFQKKNSKDKDWRTFEDLYIPPYEYAVEINYNPNNIPNKGSAIFLHVGNKQTAGCIATNEENMKFILNWLNPEKNPIISIGE